jgi:hypothetical protein
VLPNALKAAMTKSSKLYEQLLANPNTIISFRDFERLLDRSGGRTSAPKAAIAHMRIRGRQPS